MQNPLRNAIFLAALVLAGCGTHVPDLNELTSKKSSETPIGIYNITDHIQCEIQHAVQSVIITDIETQRLAARAKPELHQGRSLQWFENYAAQVTLTLTLEETGTVNASMSAIKPFQNGITNVNPVDKSKYVSTPRNETLGLSAAYSTKATVQETLSFFVPFSSFTNAEAIDREIANRNANHELDCRRAGGTLIEGDLKLNAWLNAVMLRPYGDPYFAASLAAQQEVSKKDVIQHKVTFVVTTNGGVNPSLKLVNLTANQSTVPFLFGQRVRTQDVIITMAPNSKGQLTPFGQQTLFSTLSNGNQGL